MTIWGVSYPHNPLRALLICAFAVFMAFHQYAVVDYAMPKHYVSVPKHYVSICSRHAVCVFKSDSYIAYASSYGRYDQQERASNRRAEISSSPSPSGRGHKRRRHEEDSPPYHQRSKESPALPSIGQILRGKVHTVKPFGEQHLGLMDKIVA